LVAVAEEKDRLAPALEETRWRGRQLEKEVAQGQVGWVPPVDSQVERA
jgi:hypothetical protein